MNLMSAFCDIFFKRDLFIWFKSFTDLELGVSEFWQLFLTQFLSLESVLGFCHGIAKERDSKVEFIQLCVGFILCEICL